MITFLNERSLETHNDWAAALELFWRIASCAPTESLLLRDGNYFDSGDFKKRFNHSIGKLSPDRKSRAREMVFSDRYCRCWRAERVSDSAETYYCEPPEKELRDCSITEGAGRLHRGETAWVGVLSAADSSFGQSNRIQATRSNDNKEVELFNLTKLEEWRQALSSQRGTFDPTLNEVPRDFQTVLVKDATRFERTGKVERRSVRQVYREVSTGCLFYVDEGHPGHSSHLEVFDSQRRHLGVADIESGELNVDQKVRGRRLRY